MFESPITITVNSVDHDLDRTGTGADTGAFASATRAFRLQIAHAYGRRVRRSMRLTHDSLVANPLVSGQNINQSISVSLVIDAPAGYDTTTAKHVVDGFVAELSASSGAAITKLLAGRS